jgi:hypothetical protein
MSRLDVYLVLAKSYPNAENILARFEEIIKTLDIDTLMRGETLPVR